MTEKDFLTCVEELVEAPAGKLSMNSVITEIEGFDSITLIGLVSFADTHGIAVTPDAFFNITTLNDIFKEINRKR